MLVNAIIVVREPQEALSNKGNSMAEVKTNEYLEKMVAEQGVHTSSKSSTLHAKNGKGWVRSFT